MSFLVHALAAATITDIGLLGLGRGAANERAFMLADAMRAPTLLAERLQQSAFRFNLSDGIEEDVRALCDASDYSLVKLATLAMDANVDQHEPGTWLPLELFRTKDDLEQILYPADIELADSHLNSGAALEMHGFCRLMTQSSDHALSKPRVVASRDFNSTWFDAKVVVHGLRHFLQYHWDLEGRERRLMAGRIQGGTFWAEVGAAALGLPECGT